MQNLQFIEFQQLNSHYFICKTCSTHIALAEDFIFHHTPEPDVTGGVFNKIANVHAEDEPRRLKRIASHIFADIYCNRCNSVLGIKYVEVDKNQTLIKNGMLQLNIKRLIMRHGNHYFDGETMGLLPPPDQYMCWNCGSHIAWVPNVLQPASKVGPHRISRIIFRKVVNVRIIHDPSQPIKVGPHTYAGVHCVYCNLLLGWKIIASHDRWFTSGVQSEMVQLYTNCLLRSHGYNIVPAETVIPPGYP